MYYGINAEYNDQKDVYEQRVAEARAARKGIWSLGSDIRESPGAYKRRMKDQDQQKMFPTSSNKNNTTSNTRYTTQKEASGAPEAEAMQQVVWTGWHVSKDNSHEETVEDTNYGLETVVKPSRKRVRRRRGKRKGK